MLKNLTSNPIALLLAGSAIVYTLNQTGNKVLDGFKVDSASILESEYHGSGVDVRIELVVKNENPVGGTVSALAGALFLGVNTLATLSLTSPDVFIPAEGKEVVPVTANIKYLNFLGNLLVSITSGAWEDGAKVAGTVTMANGLVIPFEQNLIKIG